jgi:hypothetical protein
METGTIRFSWPCRSDPIEALSRPREFFFVHHSDHKNSAANRLFFTFVKEYFQDPANLPTHPAPEALEDMP